MLKCKTEGLMTFVAEWFSLEEMKALWAREWQHKDFLSDLDDQVRRDLSDDWITYLSEKEKSPAL